MLRVRLLGELAIEGGEPPAGRPARELLAYLALRPGMHPRLELAMRFWPDVPETSARASLRTALHELRRALGDAAGHLTVDRERVGLTDVWVDLRDLDDPEALLAAEPLSGIERDWAVAARDEHRERVSALLETRAQTSLRWAREWVKHDPLSEEAACRLMTLLADSGDRAAAMSAYVRLEDRLQRELSVPPSRQTRRLLAEIRAGAAAPLGTARSPLPPALAPRGGRLAGRDEELERLVAVRTGALLLAGEPGIGKTRLLAEAGRAAHARGATVLYGRCYEEQVAPYEPFAEALGADAFARLLDAAAGERWRLFEAIGARVEGSVLLLDDLHWADAGTLRLLAHLLRRPRAPVVLGAYRDGEVGPALADMLADLRREGLAERLPLRGLSAEAVATLAGERAEALHRETGGNPLFVQEMLRAGGEIPDSVKDVIARRVARLAPQTGQVLAVASVAGTEFDLELLEAVLDADILAALEEAAAAQVVREERPGRYAFTHALVCEAIYDELSLTRRARTHATLADALAGPPGEIARHRLAAGDPSAAAEAVLVAAAEAMRALAYEEAAALAERALAIAPRDPRLLLALGEARLRAGEPAREAFADAAAIAREDGAAELLARAALGFSGLGVTIIAVDREAVALLEEALDAVGEHPLRARLLARLAIETYYTCTPAERKALGDEAVSRARGTDALLDALDARHAALWSAQYLDERLQTANEMLALARDNAERELQARNWLVVDHFERGDIAAVKQEIEAHEKLAERLRLPAYTWWGPMWRATLAILEGRYEEAERLIASFAGTDHPNARLYAEIQGYQLDWNRGRFDLYTDTAPLDREAGRPAEAAYRAGHALILAARGNADEARAQIAWVVEHGLRDDMNLLAGLAELAQAITILDDPAHAAWVLERLAPYQDRNIVNGRGAAGYGSAAYHVATLTAVLGRDATAAIDLALQQNAALGSEPWLERTRRLHARPA